MRNRADSFGDFKCTHCQSIVSSAHMLSGVNNRNHCPYCLWSRHLDLFAAGDRLSACKASMQPVGLTTKHSRNKYSNGHGELMLVHLCVECAQVSINRIAADDDAQTLLSILADSFALSAQTRALICKNQINILEPESTPLVRMQLFGRRASIDVAEVAF
jgi:RNHCP domain-containing protein